MAARCSRSPTSRQPMASGVPQPTCGFQYGEQRWAGQDDRPPGLRSGW